MKIPNEVKAIAVSGAPLVGALLLFLIVANFGISAIKNTRAQISQSQSDQNILNQKLNILNAIAPSAADLSNSAALALPSSNTSLAVFSQLKNLALVNALLLTNIKTGSEVKDNSGLSRVDVSFDISGTRDQINSFLKGVSGLAPIMIVSSIKLSENAGVNTGGIIVQSFWAPLPKSIPTTTEAITDLTPDEQAVLATVQSLTSPIIVQGQPAQPGGKSDPFAPVSTPAP